MLQAENEAVTKQAETLTKQLSDLHDQAETVIRLEDELEKAQERIKVFSSAPDVNAEAVMLVDAMQGKLTPFDMQLPSTS